MTDPQSTEQLIELFKALSPLGASGILIVAVIALWRKQDTRESNLSERVRTLEQKQDEHAKEYRELSERAIEALTQTKDALNLVMAKLKS